jgi:hypothetical protein
MPSASWYRRIRAKRKKRRVEKDADDDVEFDTGEGVVQPAKMVTNNQGEVEFEMDRYHAPALMVFLGEDRGRTILKEHAEKGMEWTNHTLFINRIREPHWMSSDWYKIAVMRLIWSGTVVCKKDGRSMVYKLHDVETSNDEKIWNPFTRNYAR